jgi:hypothetical protein
MTSSKYEGVSMSAAEVFWDSVGVNLKVGPDIRDITGQLEAALSRAGIENGVLHTCEKGAAKAGNLAAGGGH